MVEFCIVADVASKLKEAFRNGDLDINTLYDISSPERYAMFSQYMSPELAHEVNTTFEKAMISKQKEALVEWAKKTLDPQSLELESITSKINKLDELGLITNDSEAFLYDLVANKMGVAVTPTELQFIADMCVKLEDLSTPTETGSYSIEYYKAKNDLNKFIEGLNPAHAVKVASSVLGRANLLGIPSAIVNIASDVTPAVTMAITRRINAGRVKGLNFGLQMQMTRESFDIWHATRIDTARLDNSNPSGELRMGEKITHVEGEGVFRKIAKVYSDVIFNIFQGYADFASANYAFHDNLNLYSTKMAEALDLKGDAVKSKARELMIAANSTNPKQFGLTDVEVALAIALRQLSIADARWSTYTDKGGFSQLALNIRTTVDKATGDLMVGEFILPFVKQPANAVQRSVEATGIGAFRGFFQLKGALRSAREGNPVPLMSVTKLFVESGFGLALALLIAHSIDPDDFIPDYTLADPTEQELVNAKNATYNSIKIGDKYISLDYFGILAAPLIGWLYARKYGNNFTEKTGVFVQGALGQATRVPGIQEVYDAIGTFIKILKESKNPAEVTERTLGSFISGVIARMIPQSGTLMNISKATDVVQRKAGKDIVSQIVNAIPFLRSTLPEKINQLTGEPFTNENLVTMLLFGSRVKTATDTPLVDEILRLDIANNKPALTSIEYASTRVRDIQEQIKPEDFQTLIENFGKTYNTNASKLIVSATYLKADDEKKKAMLDDIRTKALDAFVLEATKKYGYKKPVVK